MPSVYFSASHDLIQRFLANTIGPAVLILLLWLLLSALDALRLGQPPSRTEGIPHREILAAAGFACIPLLGLIGCKLSHGPFLDRYFLSSIAGYAIFLGFACSRAQSGWSTAKVLAGCMFLLMLLDLGSTIYLRAKHRIVLAEPSSGFALSTSPANPMALYDTLSMNKNGLDILVLPSLEYLYFFRYASPSVVSHLYFGASADDVFLAAYEKLAKGAHVNLKTTTYLPFLATHDRFLVYERGNTTHIDAMQAIANGGYSLIAAQADAGGIMYEYSK